MLHPKVLPALTHSRLLPPNQNYAYFSGASAFPFPCAEAEFDMRNAWWLAEASLLSYADETFATQQWAGAGVVQVRAIRGPGTLCYVAVTDRFIIVAFRGAQVLRKGEGTTLPDVLEDWKTDAKVALVNCGVNGTVHQGFTMALDEVWWGRHQWPGLKAYLDSLTAGQAWRSLWFTGHGLGAALATLAASRYGQAAGLYTFGSPHVGDLEFAKSFRMPVYRFVNASDMVPSFLATFGRFEHVGVLKSIRSDGSIVDGPARDWRLGDRVRKLLAGRSHGIESFADHAPLSYAIRLWNACLQTSPR